MATRKQRAPAHNNLLVRAVVSMFLHLIRWRALLSERVRLSGDLRVFEATPYWLQWALRGAHVSRSYIRASTTTSDFTIRAFKSTMLAFGHLCIFRLYRLKLIHLARTHWSISADRFVILVTAPSEQAKKVI